MGNHPMVSRVLRGTFNLGPPVGTALGYGLLRLLGPTKKLELRALTYKTLMLLAQATVRRVGSLVLLSLKPVYIEISDSSIKFQPIGLEKWTHVDSAPSPIQVEVFKMLIGASHSCERIYQGG